MFTLDDIGWIVFVTFKILLISIIISIPIYFGICTILQTEYNEQLKEYNNGKCECGGNYNFINYAKGHLSGTYVFQCDNCNKIVLLNENPLE